MEIALFLLIILLIAVSSLRPGRCGYSRFELGRRLEDKTDEAALLDWRREEMAPGIDTLRHVVSVGLLVLIVALLTITYQLDSALLVSFLVALLYERVAALGIVRKLTGRYYSKYEQQVLRVAESLQPALKFIRTTTSKSESTDMMIHSREELEHIVNQADSMLTSHERKAMKGALGFEEKLVKDYMTPRSVMEAIGAHEMLGPLVLDGLHRTGHSHFPVFDGDIDHIVGLLHIHTLFRVGEKDSKTAQDAMEPGVLYIHEDQTLGEALDACIKHRRHLLVVINEFRETVGVITIEDAVEQMIGRKIVDQFDKHDDLRAVAARNPRGNNKTKKSLDV